MALTVKVTQKLDLQRRAAVIGKQTKPTTESMTVTTAMSGALIIVNNASKILSLTLPLVNACNGCWWTFFNATANGFMIVGDSNAILSPGIGVNAADKIKNLYYNHTTNWGLTCDIISDGTTYFHIPHNNMLANVGPGFLQA